jgi:hypothetical protein
LECRLFEITKWWQASNRREKKPVDKTMTTKNRRVTGMPSDNPERKLILKM